jgi:hypothetical protein
VHAVAAIVVVPFAVEVDDVACVGKRLPAVARAVAQPSGAGGDAHRLHGAILIFENLTPAIFNSSVLRNGALIVDLENVLEVGAARSLGSASSPVAIAIIEVVLLAVQENLIKRVRHVEPIVAMPVTEPVKACLRAHLLRLAEVVI